MNKLLEDLKKLKSVYYATEEVSVGNDLSVKVRLLTSAEETEVHAKATEYDQGLAYLYSVKRETLCRAIVGLNGKDIPTFIEDTNDKGEVEKTEKHIWLRENVISGWSQLIVDHVWSGYATLISKLEMKIAQDLKKETPEKKE